MRVQTQQMVDQVFSFAELGFQEFETSKYLTDLLEKNGFKVERGYAGVPTAWFATWGSGKPVIAIGSRHRRYPAGVAEAGRRLSRSDHRRRTRTRRRAQLRRAAQHHRGARREEDHGAGEAAGHAQVVAGRCRGARRRPRPTSSAPGCSATSTSSLFAHVGSNLGAGWGGGFGTGPRLGRYTFKGESAHSAGAPWRGRSALDAVELMDVAWNFRREHLRLQHRSHSIITNGGDQPNVVPQNASVWYDFRETDYEHIKELRDIGDSIARRRR